MIIEYVQFYLRVRLNKIMLVESWKTYWIHSFYIN